MKNVQQIEKIVDGIIETAEGFAVFEDNGGGLHLAVWYGENEEDFYCHTGYEYTPGQLINNLQDLAEGDHPKNWENMKDMKRDEWREMVNADYSGHFILNRHGLHLVHAGAAATIEFADFIEADE